MLVQLQCGRCAKHYAIQISCEELGLNWAYVTPMVHIINHTDSNDCISHLLELVKELQQAHYETSRPLVEVIEFVNQVKLAINNSSGTINIPSLHSWPT
jgi:hypothetical protein